MRTRTLLLTPHVQTTLTCRHSQSVTCTLYVVPKVRAAWCNTCAFVEDCHCVARAEPLADWPPLLSQG